MANEAAVSGRLVLAALSLATAAALAAQDAPSRRTDASQIAAPPSRASQTTPPGGQLGAPVADRGDRSEQLTRRAEARGSDTQVGPATPDRSRQVQLTREPRSTTPGSQLYLGRASASGPEPLSRRAEGRATNVVRLAGDDRCDPRAAASAARPACARVIEGRASEFEQPDPLILSPEQRLLVDQRLREGPGTTQSAAQRLGRNDVDADGLDAQSIASVALRPGEPTPSRQPQETEQPLDPQLDAIVQAIVSGTGAGTPVVTPGPR